MISAAERKMSRIRSNQAKRHRDEYLSKFTPPEWYWWLSGDTKPKSKKK